MYFGCILLNRGHCYSSCSKILMILLSRVLLHGIVQKLSCNILTLKDDIDLIFADIKGAVVKNVLCFLVNAGPAFYSLKSHKNFYAKYVLLEIKMRQFNCVQLCRERCYSVFSKIFTIILPRFPLHRILQNFKPSILDLRNDINKIYEDIAC